MVYIDIVGGQRALLGADSDKYLVSIIDSFTDWPEASRISDQSGQTVCETFIRELVRRYGLLNQIHSD